MAGRRRSEHVTCRLTGLVIGYWHAQHAVGQGRSQSMHAILDDAKVAAAMAGEAPPADAKPVDACRVWDLWQAMRQKKPLCQCITNYVSMDIMANVLLAAGASPAMAHSLDEVEDFVGIASALLINMGTLSSEWIASKKLAAHRAVQLGKPWVLDPVGCGATPNRTRACLDMLHCKPTVVRGNASEILALAGAAGSVQGVDSTQQSHAALPAAKAIAQQHGCVVAVSGKTDYVTDGTRVLAVDNGVEMLTLVTAAGCALTALIAAFLVPGRDDPVTATAAALSVFGLAGELALVKVAVSEIQGDTRRGPGPGSLRVALIDLLHTLMEQEVVQGARVSVLA